ncbi:MAG: hypothetical protein RIF34_01920 [Candidatus Kapaibacterium sp.]
MSNSPAPTNYQWINNILTFDLETGVTGVKLKYQKDGDTNWTDILDSPDSAQNSCLLNASTYGPSGTVCGATKTSTGTGGGWGTEVCYPIVNS